MSGPAYYQAAARWKDACRRDFVNLLHEQILRSANGRQDDITRTRVIQAMDGQLPPVWQTEKACLVDCLLALSR